MFFNFIKRTSLHCMEHLCPSGSSPCHSSFILLRHLHVGFQGLCTCSVISSRSPTPYFCSELLNLSVVLMAKRWVLYLLKWFPVPRRKKAEETSFFSSWGFISLLKTYIFPQDLCQQVMNRSLASRESGCQRFLAGDLPDLNKIRVVTLRQGTMC